MTVREDRVQELSGSSYEVLRESWGLVRELKGMMDRFHAGCLQGKPIDYDTLTAVKLTTDRLYEGMERYLRPECDPDSAHPDAMTELSR